METIIIDFKNTQLEKNFSEYEFYVAAKPNHVFKFPKALVHAAQIVRDWVGFQTNVTSTSRPADTFGYHRYDSAIDLCAPYTIHGGASPKSPEQVLADFKNECLNYIAGNGSALIESLRKIGVNGFGVECGCIHLDIRPDSPYNRKDAYGTYCVFEFKCHYDASAKMIIDINRAL